MTPWDTGPTWARARLASPVKSKSKQKVHQSSSPQRNNSIHSIATTTTTPRGTMDTYQFSQVYRASAISFSPGSTFIAAAIEDHVMIRSTSSLDLIRTWHCSSSLEASSPGPVPQRKPHAIDFLEWSSDGSRLLAFTSKGGQAWVLDLSSGEQVANLANGITRVEWGGSSILAWSDRVCRLCSASC